jgi:hypothetical protein
VLRRKYDDQHGGIRHKEGFCPEWRSRDDKKDESASRSRFGDLIPSNIGKIRIRWHLFDLETRDQLHIALLARNSPKTSLSLLPSSFKHCNIQHPPTSSRADQNTQPVEEEWAIRSLLHDFSCSVTWANYLQRGPPSQTSPPTRNAAISGL